MREFSSLSQFGLYLATLEIAEAIALHKGLERVAKLVENTAKNEIGFYQSAIGPFQDWAPLADSTEEEKSRLGYATNAPLLRTGEMRDSIKHEVDGLDAIIGSEDDKLVWQEFGTERIPPRPVLGPAAFRNKEKIEKIMGHAAVTGLIGGQLIHEALGYDFET